MLLSEYIHLSLERYLLFSLSSIKVTILIYARLSSGANVVILKTESPERQWYSSMLQPYVHYIPVHVRPFHVPLNAFKKAQRTNSSLRQRSDVVQQIQWALRNPEICKRILHNAHHFYQRYLTDEAMECYIRSLLHKVSSLYTFNVTEKVEVLMRKYGVRLRKT